MIRSIIAFLLTYHGVVFGGVSVFEATDSNAYEVVDRLESYGCAYSTLRLLRPQTHEDLRSAVYAEGAEMCQAPEWLLRERQRLFIPSGPSFFEAQSLSMAPEEIISLQGIEANVTPLFPFRQGRPSVGGTNLYLELTFNADSGQSPYGLGISVTPAFAALLQDYEAFSSDFYLQQGYVKAGYGWAELLVGKMNLQFGDAKHGALMLSRATKPMEMIKFTLRPHIMGGPLHALGPFSFETFVARLGPSQFVADAKLWGVTFGLRPAAEFETALLILNQFSGEGAADLEISDFLRMLIFSGSDDLDLKRHRGLTWHLGFWLFQKRLKWYTQFYFEKLGEIGTWFNDDVSALMGFWLPRLGELDLRLEVVNIVPTAYQHPFWKQGFTHQGTALGHPLGPDARAAYLDVGFPFIEGFMKPELNLGFEQRLLNPQAGQATEQRITVGANLHRRWTSTSMGVAGNFATLINPLYLPGQTNTLFSVYAWLKYELTSL